jgi:hypothetical protein
MHDLPDQLPAEPRRAKGTRSKLVALVSSVLALGAVSTGVAVSAAAAGPNHDAIAEVRDATTMFHDVPTAKHAGYSKFTDVNGVTCIAGPPGRGTMGVHFVNGAFVGDGKIDADHPEAVLYDPTSKGLELTAVEYIVIASDWHGAQPPELFDHPFMLVPAPNRYGLPPFYALHAWIWKNNPSGRFQPWNPDVKCRAQAE